MAKSNRMRIECRCKAVNTFTSFLSKVGSGGSICTSAANQIDLTMPRGGKLAKKGKKILVLTARAITITIIIRFQPSTVRFPLTCTLRKLPHLGAKRWDFDSCDKTEAWLRCTFAVAPSNDSHLNYVKWPGQRLQAPLNSMCVCMCVCVWNLFIC